MKPVLLLFLLLGVVTLSSHAQAPSSGGPTPQADPRPCPLMGVLRCC
ncbi:hypothetical protein [Hymenobacter sp. BRD67]|nr:hypothetical protein [Hymenobacter sp. BRD67]